MNIAKLFIRRHVFAYMISAILILFGVISIQGIGVERLPKLNFPVVSITTTNAGASPEIMATSITAVIESAVNSIPGIEYVESTSISSFSYVQVRFSLSKDPDVAFNEVQAKVNQILDDIPAESDTPVIAKIEPNAIPVMWLVLKGDRTIHQLNQIARLNVKKQLETIDGVGEVVIGGGRERTIRIDLELKKMYAMGITVQDVIGAFRKEHINYPGGYLVSGQNEHLLHVDMEFHDVLMIHELIVAHKEGSPIRLGDLAKISDGLSDFRGLARYNRQEAIGVGIVKIGNANTVAIVKEVKSRIKENLQPSLPDGVEILVATNEADIVENLIEALEEHIVEGIVLAAIVVWFFLLSFRSTLVISSAIPVSLLGAATVLYFFGYTFNTMTLLGLLLLIGVVVDDAIVVLENIHRHMELKKEDRESASVIGTEEVIFPVIASSLTLVCIFATVIFMGGMIGQFVRPFAVVVTAGVMTSLLVSITLTPVLCSRYLVIGESMNGFYGAIRAGHNRLEGVYKKILAWTLRFRLAVVLVAVGVVVTLTSYILNDIGSEFFPEDDESRFIVKIKAPLGSSIEYVVSKLDEVETIILGHEEVTHVFSTIGATGADKVNEADVSVLMTPMRDRSIHQHKLQQLLQDELSRIPGIEVFIAPFPLVGGIRGESLHVILKGPDMYRVAELANAYHNLLMADSDIGRLDLVLNLDLPMLAFDVDRPRISAMGLSTKDVAETVSVLGGGIDIAKYNDIPGDGERYDVRVSADKSAMRRPSDLNKIYLRGKDGGLIRLDSIVDITGKVGPASISRYNLSYSAEFFSTPRVPLGDAINKVRRVAEELLPPGYGIEMGGQASEMEKTYVYISFIFVTGILMVYMVLASQFNSFIQPLIVMLAQPLAMVGGVLGLWLFGYSLNIYSMIGLLLLIGLVAKNSILLVDLTNRRRSDGLSTDAALLEACPTRMRPVLMTSFTVILALMPAASGIGAGAEQYGSLAVAVIGGMVSSTLLTLVVVPAAYSLVEKNRTI